MQLLFSAEELQLLVEALEERERALRGPGNEKQHSQTEQWLDRVASRDLRFSYDEMEDLLELLKAFKSALPSTDAARFQQKQKVLNAIIDRVAEACAMA